MMRFQLVLLTHTENHNFVAARRCFGSCGASKRVRAIILCLKFRFQPGQTAKHFSPPPVVSPQAVKIGPPPLAVLWGSRTWGFLSSPAVVALASAEISRTYIYSDLIGTL